LVASLLVVGSWWIFVSEQARGAGLDEARTAAVNLFVAVEIAYLFSCRSLAGASWRLGLFTNRWIIGGVLVQVCAQAAFTYLPFMNQIFGTSPIEVEAWLRILGAVIAISLVITVDKFVALRRAARTHDLPAQMTEVKDRTEHQSDARSQREVVEDR